MNDFPHGERRGRIASFLLNSLTGTTEDRYQAARTAFSNDLAVDGLDMDELAENALDWLLAERVVDLHEDTDGAAGLDTAANLIAAMRRINPRHRYKTARKALAVWRARRPPSRALGGSADDSTMSDSDAERAQAARTRARAEIPADDTETGPTVVDQSVQTVPVHFMDEPMIDQSVQTADVHIAWARNVCPCLAPLPPWQPPTTRSTRPRLAAPPVIGPRDALWAEAEAGLDHDASDSSS
jgi:hypothetical protein